MRAVRTIAELRNRLAGERPAGRTVGLVPTMGALHDGHLSLFRAARSRCDTVVATIFVNPAQFGPGEDYQRYPRSEAADLAAAEAGGVNLVFLPSVAEMYPDGFQTSVCPGRLGRIVEGAARPGHFEGVATVVAKLFNLVEPGVAFFGQKDAQQLAVVRRLIADLGFDVAAIACPTVREPDGLALSSRNAYLSAEERAVAPALYRALTRARSRARGPRDSERIMLDELGRAPGLEVDYALAVDPETFDAAAPGAPALLVVAARLGTTRLIDNLPVEQWA